MILEAAILYAMGRKLKQALGFAASGVNLGSSLNHPVFRSNDRTANECLAAISLLIKDAHKKYKENHPDARPKEIGCEVDYPDKAYHKYSDTNVTNAINHVCKEYGFAPLDKFAVRFIDENGDC